MKSETALLLNTAADANSVVQYGEARYRFARVGNGYSARRTDTGLAYMCHVAIDGTIRLSDSKRFGEFLPGC